MTKPQVASSPQDSTSLLVSNYDLDATLTSGQAFRWTKSNDCWLGVVSGHAVRLTHTPDAIHAQAFPPVSDWHWLSDYLQIEVNLGNIISTFPKDEPMKRAVAHCQGLHVLKQDPWECLASFILSSTKQIVQIQQIIRSLCRCFGDPLQSFPDVPTQYTFPSAETLAKASEAELRACKMGFRAPYLLRTAQAVASGAVDLERCRSVEVEEAREMLMTLPGVGRKIADCVLLFAYGFQEAFPIDVWVLRALRELYFPNRVVTLKRLQEFASNHFAPNSGYAQQYLFHFMRMTAGRRAK